MLPNTLQKSYANLRGFNYQPSKYSHEVPQWLMLDLDLVELELRRGKQYFPKMNAIRVWCSWQAFKHNPDLYVKNFDGVVDRAGKLDISVMPCLFNRWHDPVLDFGGIYTDHFAPRVSWASKIPAWYKDEKDEKLFEPYIDRIVGPHVNDPRIFMWDMCCEPFSYWDRGLDELPVIRDAEYAWLKGIREHIKRLKAVAPITIGMHNVFGFAGYEFVEPLCDVIAFHSYFIPEFHKKADFEKELDDTVAFAKKCGKAVLCNETVWGKLDDAEHVAIIKYTLSELAKRGIGFMPHALHWSMIADLHTREDAPVGWPENLSFINKDGSLRKGHEVYNEI